MVQLESVGVLGDLLESSVRAHTLPLSAVPEAFTRARRRAAHALQTMELYAATSPPFAVGKQDTRLTWRQTLQSALVFKLNVICNLLLLAAVPAIREAPFFRLLNSRRVRMPA